MKEFTKDLLWKLPTFIAGIILSWGMMLGNTKTDFTGIMIISTLVFLLTLMLDSIVVTLREMFEGKLH